MTAVHQNDRLRAMLQKLRQCGMRITPQRTEIIKIMLEVPTHPSVDTVFQRVRQTHPSISLATVYATLDRLARIGALQEVGGGGERRFDGHNPRPHAHLVCRSCGAVMDMELPQLWEMLHAQGAQQNFQTDALQVTLVGVCESCRALSGAEAFSEPLTVRKHQ